MSPAHSPSHATHPCPHTTTHPSTNPPIHPPQIRPSSIRVHATNAQLHPCHRLPFPDPSIHPIHRNSIPPNYPQTHVHPPRVQPHHPLTASIHPLHCPPPALTHPPTRRAPVHDHPPESPTDAQFASIHQRPRRYADADITRVIIQRAHPPPVHSTPTATRPRAIYPPRSMVSQFITPATAERPPLPLPRVARGSRPDRDRSPRARLATVTHVRSGSMPVQRHALPTHPSIIRVHPAVGPARHLFTHLCQGHATHPQTRAPTA
eukprot:XP_011671200.1 PREDICTED: early nodulin-75-like [Strongylocentrotus purpuratus]